MTKKNRDYTIRKERGHDQARPDPCALLGHGFTVGLDEERHEPIGAEVEAIGPDIVAGEIDAVPTERRELRLHGGVDRLALAL